MHTRGTIAKRRECVTYKFGDVVREVKRVNKRERRDKNLRVTRPMGMQWGRIR